MSRRRASLTLGLLTAVYGVNFIDRQIIGLLVDPIKRELHLSDTALGVLTGIAFALFYTGCSLPIARLAEIWRPKRLISLSVAVFSAATIGSALAVSYWQLLAARLVVGVGEAGTTPASTAIIASLYTPNRRNGAMSFWSAGSQVGVLVGYLLVAFVAARHGWRAGFFVAGIPGLAIALLVLRYVHDPQPTEPARRRPMRRVILSLASNRLYMQLCGAGAAALFALSATTGWMPAYLQRAYALPLSTVGLIFGLSIGVLGTAVIWGSGRLVDRLHRRHPMGGLWIAAAAMAIYIGLELGALWAPQVGGAIALVIPGLALGLVWQGPVFVRVQGLVAEVERPTAIALYVFIANAIGLGLGPLAVGAVSDAIGHGTAAGLRVGISCALATSLLGVALLCLAARGWSANALGKRELEFE